MRDDQHKTVVGGKRLAWWSASADPEFWHEFFSKKIADQHGTVTKGKTPRYVRRTLRYLPKTGKLIEAGCGTGWIVAYLIANGYQAEGVDSSERLIAEVRERFPKLPIRVGDVLALDAADNQYAGYLSFGVIEHRQEGCQPFLEEACRILVPGGIACISVPHFNPLRMLKARMQKYAQTPPPGCEFYQYAFTKPYFAEALQATGFRLLKFYTYGAQWCLPEEFHALFERIRHTRGLWRLLHYVHHLDVLDSTGLASHMLMAVVQKPL